MDNKYEIADGLAENIQYTLSNIMGLMGAFRTIGCSSDYLSYEGHVSPQFWSLITATEHLLRTIEQELDDANRTDTAQRAFCDNEKPASNFEERLALLEIVTGKTAPKIETTQDGDFETTAELSRFVFETIDDFNWLCAGSTRRWQEDYIRQMVKQRATIAETTPEIQQAHAVYLQTEQDLVKALNFVDAKISKKGLRGDKEKALEEKHVYPILHEQKHALAQVLEAVPGCEMDFVLKLHVLAKEKFNVHGEPHTKITTEIDDFLAINGG